MGRKFLILTVLVMTLCGCGNVDWFPTIGPDSPATITVTSSASSPVVNASVTITATVKKQDGTPVADGTQVSFTTVGGTLSAFSATTSGGVATVTLTSSSAISCRVTASSGVVNNSVTVTYISGVSLTASPSSAAVGNNVTITVTAKKSDGNPVDNGTTVVFAAPNGGNLSALSATTTGGTATVTFSSGVIGTFTVTASVGSDSASILVSFF